MESQQRYLNGEYFEANPTFHVEDSPWKAAQIAKMLDRHQLSPHTVCEIGCGAGEILRSLQLRYPEIVLLHGYEISPQGYALAQQRQNEHLQFFNVDLFADQHVHYELALCFDVFEHVEDYFHFLRNLRRYADYFIFHIPLDMNVQMVLRGEPIQRVREQVGHIHYFSKDTALATLNDTGYRVVDWFYTPSAIDLAKTMKSRIAKIPRQLAARISPEFTARVLGGYSLLVYAS
jgi:cyclopropane fatty-acyl-phospholipid synthase-like methyltransferase